MKIVKVYLGLWLYCGSFSSAEPGDLIEYNYQSTFSITAIQFVLNSLGNGLSIPVYPISVYDIKYESHSQTGIIDTLAGLVIVPQSPTEAFPILTYQHGTIILDSQAPSVTGVGTDNLEVLLVSLVTAPSGFITSSLIILELEIPINTILILSQIPIQKL